MNTATAPARAYYVEVRGWPGAEGICAATSPAKAKYRAFSAAKEAGYEVRFDGMMRLLVARRAPKYDEIIQDLRRGFATVEYADKLRQN